MSIAAGDESGATPVDSDVEDFDLDAEEGNPAEQTPTQERVRVTGSEGLSLEETNALVSTQPSTVVLIAGEANVGKTTLLVELYAQFLSGPLNGWKFAGSRTLRGFHKRHEGARASSGDVSPTTARTQDALPQHLHLQVARNDQMTSLVISDVRGEVFENVANGVRAEDEIPFIRRVDLCVVLLDGEQMTSKSLTSLQILKTRQLIEGLLHETALRANCHVSIVCSKVDLLSPAQRGEADVAIQGLVRHFANATQTLDHHLVSARPGGGGASVGLDRLFEFFVKAPERTPHSPAPHVTKRGRFFWRGVD